MSIARYFQIDYEFSHEQVLQRIDACCAGEYPSQGRHKAAYICVADVNIVVQVHCNPDYRDIVQGALFTICDSSWVPFWLKRMYGFKPDNYSGSDIFSDIINSRRYRMAFLGSSAEVLESLRERLKEIDPAIGDMLFKALPFEEADGFDYDAISAEVNDDNPDIIWVALGAPKQEYFAARLAPLLHRGVIIPVGAVFNFRSGVGIRRAPDWMIRCHLEFVYRIFSEPRKQIRRFLQSIRHIPAILREERRSAGKRSANRTAND